MATGTSLPDDPEDLKLLEIHRRTLALLVSQWSMQTDAHLSPEVLHGIISACAEIRRIKRQLRRKNVDVTDQPNDNADERLPGVRPSQPVSASMLKHYVEGRLHWLQKKNVDRYDIPIYVRDNLEQKLIDDIVDEYDRIVITGSPGGGKTMFMLRTLLVYTENLKAYLDQRTKRTGRVTIPIYLELGILSPQQGDYQRNLARLIIDELNIPTAIDPLQALEHVLERANLLLLLDGLNELAPIHRENYAKGIVALENRLQTRYPHTRLTIVVTSRTYGFTDFFSEHEYQVVEILPIDLEEIEQQLFKYTKGYANLKRIDIRTRQLLSNPQNLTYLIEILLDTQGAMGNAEYTITKGKIIEYFCKKNMRRINPERAHIIEDILQRLAYNMSSSNVFFDAPHVYDAIDTILKMNHLEVEIGKIKVFKEILHSGLLIDSDGYYRFAHHSVQQYYAACQMKRLWKLDEYITRGYWHEPLVLMAGILDQAQLQELLAKLHPNRSLYAYVLANIHQPDAERAFLGEVVGEFIKHTHQWARGIRWLLALYATIWFVLLPFLSYFLFDIQAQNVLFVLVALGLFYMFVLPSLLVRWHKRQLNQRIEKYTQQDLPQLIAILKFFMSRGPIRDVIDGLENVQGSMLDYEEGDPALMFIEEAIDNIYQLELLPIYMTEDEMLEQASDPLVAAAIDPQQLSEKGVDLLCQKSLIPGDDTGVIRLMAILEEIYTKNPEYQKRIADVMRTIVSTKTFSCKRRRYANAICHHLGITGVSNRLLFQCLLTALISGIHRLRNMLSLGQA